MFKELLLEYFNESSIHGMRYLTDTRKTYLERFCWIVFLIFSIGCCCWFTAQLYTSAQQSSIVVTISNRPLKISDILFPSITICPIIKFNISVWNMKKVIAAGMSNPNFTSSETRTLMGQYCNSALHKPAEPFDFVQTLKRVNLRLSLLSIATLGVNREIIMNEFQEIITNNGVCFTYNSGNTKELYRSHNSSTYDFSTNLTQTSQTTSYKPKNILGPFELGKIDLLLRVNSNQLENSCQPQNEGFVIALRSPYEVVVINSADIVMKADYGTELALTPSVLQCSEDLRSFKVSNRECYFENERTLFFLRYYTQDNCHFECLTNQTLKQCECVLYYMPRLKSTAVCFGSDSINCASNLEQSYDNMGIGPCHCYDLCNSISYQINVATHKLNVEKFLSESKGKFMDTRIAIYTKEKRVYPLYRSQLYGFNDYVANFGGLLGLFLGVSILSIIEIFYYLLVRPLCVHLGRRRVASKVNEMSKLNAKRPMELEHDHTIKANYGRNQIQRLSGLKHFHDTRKEFIK